jgi:hypothetical protein
MIGAVYNRVTGAHGCATKQARTQRRARLKNGARLGW